MIADETPKKQSNTLQYIKRNNKRDKNNNSLGKQTNNKGRQNKNNWRDFLEYDE